MVVIIFFKHFFVKIEGFALKVYIFSFVKKVCKKNRASTLTHGSIIQKLLIKRVLL